MKMLKLIAILFIYFLFSTNGEDFTIISSLKFAACAVIASLLLIALTIFVKKYYALFIIYIMLMIAIRQVHYPIIESILEISSMLLIFLLLLFFFNMEHRHLKKGCNVTYVSRLEEMQYTYEELRLEILNYIK